jgi:hypothetical protein
MALQNQQRDNSQQANQGDENRQENQGNRSAQTTSSNPDNQSVSTAGDTSDGKGSRTGVRKDEKEQNDNYDSGRQS